MRAVNLKNAEITTAPPAAQPGAGWLEFASHLARKHSITGDLLARSGPADRSGGHKRLRELWEHTSLSASDFADEVARFYNLPRVNLPELVAATSLASRFSHRYLREAAVFPCQMGAKEPTSSSSLIPPIASRCGPRRSCLGNPSRLRWHRSKTSPPCS